MRQKLGSIILGVCMSLFVLATIAASYYSSTTHSDQKLCLDMTYALGLIDGNIQINRILVNNSTLDPALRQKLTVRDDTRRDQIRARIKHSGCAS